MSDYQRPHNTVLVPCDKLKEMQDRIKELEKYLGFKDSGYDIISANAPREWQYLTDDEIKEIVGSYGSGLGAYVRDLFNKIEAKIKEKNVQKT